MIRLIIKLYDFVALLALAEQENQNARVVKRQAKLDKEVVQQRKVDQFIKGLK